MQKKRGKLVIELISEIGSGQQEGEENLLRPRKNRFHGLGKAGLGKTGPHLDVFHLVCFEFKVIKLYPADFSS
jgi:hypothetical protein